jgi:hypothetical protein
MKAYKAIFGSELEMFDEKEIKLMIVGYMKNYIEEYNLKSFYAVEELTNYLQIING